MFSIAVFLIFLFFIQAKGFYYSFGIWQRNKIPVVLKTIFLPSLIFVWD